MWINFCSSKYISTNKSSPIDIPQINVICTYCVNTNWGEHCVNTNMIQFCRMLFVMDCFLSGLLRIFSMCLCLKRGQMCYNRIKANKRHFFKDKRNNTFFNNKLHNSWAVKDEMKCTPVHVQSILEYRMKCVLTSVFDPLSISQSNNQSVTGKSGTIWFTKRFQPKKIIFYF